MPEPQSWRNPRPAPICQRFSVTCGRPACRLGCTSGGRHSCGRALSSRLPRTHSPRSTLGGCSNRFYVGWFLRLRKISSRRSTISFERARTSRNILCFACYSIAACAVIAKGGAGRGASGHSSAPQDIPSWMKFTRRSSLAARLRVTIPCSIRWARSRPSGRCGCGSAGGDPLGERS